MLDAEWERLGRPDPFHVIEGGAGPGTLARAILAADPRCREAMRYVAVEVSATQRAMHPAGIDSVDTLPAGPVIGVVIANELLDNLAFSPVVRHDGQAHAALVDLQDDRLVVTAGPPINVGADVVVSQRAAGEWVSAAHTLLTEGRLVVIDYARQDSADVEIRTYRGHDRGREPLVALGTQDITVDVDLPQLFRSVGPPNRQIDQASWLREHGIDALVEAGRRVWEERAHLGDLEALKARSRINEAAALTDPSGLGSFTVLEWPGSSPNR